MVSRKALYLHREERGGSSERDVASCPIRDPLLAPENLSWVDVGLREGP